MSRRKVKRRAYDTDLSDGQWALIAPLIPEAEPCGRPRKASTRELVNAVLFFIRSGAAWRLLPHDLPPWQTVYYYLRRWQREGVWNQVHHVLVIRDREHVGREASPTAGMLDSQSVRTADQKAAVPLDARALSALQNSALALDVYCWLAHRLHRVKRLAGERLSWKNLREQFGQEYADPKNFKREMEKALRTVRAVYQEARIEQVEGGVVLMPSPPPVPKTLVQGRKLGR